MGRRKEPINDGPITDAHRTWLITGTHRKRADRRQSHFGADLARARRNKLNSPEAPVSSASNQIRRSRSTPLVETDRRALAARQWLDSNAK